MADSDLPDESRDGSGDESRGELVDGAGATLAAVCHQIARLAGTRPAPARLRVQVSDVCVEVEWQAPAVAPATAPAAPVTTSNQETARDDNEAAELPLSGHLQVRAPTLGTFYRSPEPGAPPFVEVGDRVEAGAQVAILEAMKLMNAIVAPETGTVVEFLRKDGDQVEYDQPIMVMTSEDGES